MFRDVPECSGMFRDVPCSGFYRRPYFYTKIVIASFLALNLKDMAEIEHETAAIQQLDST